MHEQPHSATWRRIHPTLPSTLGLAAAVLLSACGGAGATTGATSGTDAGATTPSATLAPASTSAPNATSAAASTVSASSASYDDLVAALTAAGVPNAARWANEVIEYRPYPADDPTLQKLQDNLAKYNPAPETLAAILSALTP